MNLGRVLEVLLIVIVAAYFASQARIIAARWHSRQYTQTLNRPLAYAIISRPFNGTELAEFMLRAGGGDVVLVAVNDTVLYDSGWPYGYYTIRAACFLPDGSAVVVEVRARD